MEKLGKFGISKAVVIAAAIVVVIAVAVAASLIYMGTAPTAPTAPKKLRVAVIYVTPIEEPWNTVLHP